MMKFNASQYGAAYELLENVPQDIAAGDAVAVEIQRIREAIQLRFTTRLNEIKSIQAEFPGDGQRHLEVMRQNFEGFPGLNELDVPATD